MKLLKHISSYITKSTNLVLVHLMYAVGVGTTACMGKLTGKTFLVTHPASSTWRKHAAPSSLSTMY